MFVYLLLCSDGSTYVGATVNLNRRLRQHNKEIKGGAHITGSKVSQGKTWKRICHISGFPDWKACLQLEWRWKQISRKISNINPLERRIIALNELLLLEKPTSNSISYIEWSNKPCFHVEDEFEVVSTFLDSSDDLPYDIL